MKKLIIGLVIGGIIVAIGSFLAVPKIVLSERVSPLDFDDTVEAIEDAITEGGWIIIDQVNMQKTLSKSDKNIPPNIILTICEPHLVSTIMNDDKGMIASVIMPCTISIYQKQDGLTYVASVNTGLMGRMFMGTVSKVVAGAVTDDTNAFLSFLDKKAE
ncbi:DUF302 domain-containing protein [Pontiellaceae bacterium B1224]|nr:DUF302 domain-containing protein [Pontiellaceae bacterium B1224]